ncbi:alpha/beta hydrolase [Pseudonocardia pini]|uniref:alpha/beta hydrolase n=1 Tax=Pseudonocardia pini TaxID=2758030 RepID=UPI0028A997DB|nr:alpha/beta hydrolase [Pseudonocardia pini]
MDPELAPLAPRLRPADLRDPERARYVLRRTFAALPAPDASGVAIETREIPGAVSVRVLRPAGGGVPAAVLDVHGGGFVCGEARDGDAVNVALVRALGVTVVSVDYRLAPEHPYPAALDDCEAAFRWLVDQPDIDPRRLALHGSSAGAGLCAALALRLRDRGGPAPAFQFLSIPELDDRVETPSARAFVDTPMWTREAAELSWEAYLGAGRRGAADVSPHAAPARATDLTGLPPAYVSVMALDPLRDEGIAYALALQAAGVPVELHLFPGTFHGSGLLPAAISRREAAERVAVLGKALGVPLDG